MWLSLARNSRLIMKILTARFPCGNFAIEGMSFNEARSVVLCSCLGSLFFESLWRDFKYVERGHEKFYELEKHGKIYIWMNFLDENFSFYEN